MTGRSLRRLALLAFGSLLVAAVAGGVWANRQLHAPWKGWEGPSVEVALEPGLGARSVLSRLHEAGILRRPWLARAWMRWNGGAEKLQAGEYRFIEAASTVAVLDRLQRGDVVLYSVTIPEGLNLVEIAGRFEQEGFGTLDALLAAFRDPAPIADLDAAAEDLEGYLFPDTYRFSKSAGPREVTDAMVRRFRSEVDAGYVERARDAGLDLRGAVTLASLIEKETSLTGERGRISRVFHNRLERGMRLQCDPTVIYALERDGREVGRLTYADLEYVSPWNTYQVTGLPAGPIASPGAESLQAAVAPDDGADLYFVASPDGGHTFSPSLGAHLRAVARWRRHVRSSR